MSGGFNNPIVGGGGSLAYPSIHSPNFETGVQGWSIDKNGNAEFDNLTFRGTFNGDDWVINSAGIFFYSGTAALGNLVASVSNNPNNSTDPFGNAYLTGVGSYIFGSGIQSGVQLNGGSLNFYFASSEAGPYTFGGGLGLSIDGLNALFMDFPGGFEGTLNLPQPLPTITTLPDDTNSGTTWVSGERAFMNNNWVTPVNNNFAAIQAALATAGIFV